MRAALVGAIAAGLVAAQASLPGFPSYSDFAGAPYQVTYDNRSVFLNGERALFVSAGFHYIRFSPGQWDDIFIKAKADGFNQVQTYVFWNSHQPHFPTEYDLDYNKNLTAFLDKAVEHGMFVNFRIGPYVCAEVRFGGFPSWLMGVPSIQTRQNNDAWKSAMSAFFNTTVQTFRNYFADRGGPIVMMQVENELGNGDPNYVDWCGDLAAEQGTNALIEMCNGHSAPNTVNSCNGFDCTGFIEGHGQNGQVLVSQPALWTENWIDWFQSWSDGSPAWTQDFTGEAKSKAQGLMKWFARGGAHYNWYMYAGGNHFGTNAGSGMTNIYYWGSPLNSDGLSNPPVRTHLRNFNLALSSVADVIINAPAGLGRAQNLSYSDSAGSAWQPGTSAHQGFAYSSGGSTVWFLENNEGTEVYLQVPGSAAGQAGIAVPGNSATLLGANGTVLFNSNTIGPQYVPGTQRVWQSVLGGFSWASWSDPSVPAAPADIPAPSAVQPPAPFSWNSTLGLVSTNAWPYETVNFTSYDSEFLPYTTTLSAAARAGLRDWVAKEAARRVATARGEETRPTLAAAARAAAASVPLTISTGLAQVFQVYLDGALVGFWQDSTHNHGFLTANIALNASSLVTVDGSTGAVAVNEAAAGVLVLFSEGLGIDGSPGVSVNNGASIDSFSSNAYKGIVGARSGKGAVTLGGVDITSGGWTMASGLVGEALEVYTEAGGAKVSWSTPAVTASTPVWYRASFVVPPALMAQLQPSSPGAEVTATLHLDVVGLGRGRLYVNGVNLGRFWSKQCGGQYCQRYTFIPVDLLLPFPAANSLVILDAQGATNITGVALTLSYQRSPPPCGASTAGSIAQTVDCSSTPASNLRFVQTRDPVTGGYVYSAASNSSLCLAAAGTNPTTNSPGVQIVPCATAGSAAVWTPGSSRAPNGAVTLSNGASPSGCLDIPNQVSSTGVALDIWTCNGGSNQYWLYDQNSGQIVANDGGNCVGTC